METPDGAGTVSSVNLLRQTVQVRLDSAPETPKCYHNCELCVIRSGKGKRPEDYVEPPLEELAKLRRQEEGTVQMTEEEALTAALDAAFGRNGDGGEPELLPGEEDSRAAGRRRNRNRSRRPKGEGMPPKAPQAAGKPQKSREEQEPRPERKRPQKPPRAAREGEENLPASAEPREGGEKRLNRHRRRRPKGNGERPSNEN